MKRLLIAGLCLGFVAAAAETPAAGRRATPGAGQGRPRQSPQAGDRDAFDPRAFGAKGDGQTLDADAINSAIAAAHAAGGGTVRLGAGTYLSTSIRLQSHVGLFLDHGATIVAADPGTGPYDEPEPN